MKKVAGLVNILHTKGYIHRNINANSIGLKKTSNGKLRFSKLGGFDFIQPLKHGQGIK